MSAPFAKGDAVELLPWGIKGTVQQCYDAVGGWRVIVKGPVVNGSNPRGLYDFPAGQVARLAA